MDGHYLDVKGLKCPLPILRAKKALAALASGEVLTVEATDAGAPTILPRSAARRGMFFLASDEADGVFRMVLRRK